MPDDSAIGGHVRRIRKRRGMSRNDLRRTHRAVWL